MSTFVWSCEKNKLKEVLTNHEIINLLDQTVDTIIFQYASNYSFQSTKMYDIQSKDTSDIIPAIKAEVELMFELYCSGAKYSSKFSWSEHVDPVDRLLAKGCYRYFIISADSITKHASIAGHKYSNCLLID